MIKKQEGRNHCLSSTIAINLQNRVQSPQPLHLFLSITALLLTGEIALSLHALKQCPHPLHL